jgi:hypothetical protein
VNNQDRMLLGEAKSAIVQCCHILGAETTNRLIAEIDAADKEPTA